MDTDGDQLNEISHEIIGAAFEVGNVLGPGFLEKVYENALVKELGARGFSAKQQVALEILYKGEGVGQYVADLVVNDKVMVELKVVQEFDDIHMAQCLNYLKATGLRLCLLVNFYHPKVQIKRIIH
jgi:GxxExxY protein